MRPLVLAFAGLIATAGLAPDAHAQTAANVVADVQAYYAGIDRSTAKFKQRIDNVTFGADEARGVVRVEKPGKMRWDYFTLKTKRKKSKAKASYLTDGTTFWAINHQNFEAVKQNIADSTLPVAVTFLMGKGNLASDFNIALDTSGTYGASGNDVLALTPKTASAQYRKLYLVVTTGGRVTESVVIDPAGNAVHYEFLQPDTTTDIDDGLFVFDPTSKVGKKYRVVGGGAKKKAPKTKTPKAKQP